MGPGWRSRDSGLAGPSRRRGRAGHGALRGLRGPEGVQPYPDAGKGADYAELVTVAALQASADSIVGLPVILGEDAGGALLHPGQGEGRLELVAADNGDGSRSAAPSSPLRSENCQTGSTSCGSRSPSSTRWRSSSSTTSWRTASASPTAPCSPSAPAFFRGTPYTVEQTGRGAQSPPPDQSGPRRAARRAARRCPRSRHDP